METNPFLCVKSNCYTASDLSQWPFYLKKNDVIDINNVLADVCDMKTSVRRDSVLQIYIYHEYIT